MTRIERVRGALGTTLVVHAATAFAAALAATPLVRAAASVAGALPSPELGLFAPGGAVFAETVPAITRSLDATVMHVALAAVATLLVGPLLLTAWLEALEGRGLRSLSLTRAKQMMAPYPRLLALRLLALSAGGIALGLSFVLGDWLRTAAPGGISDRTADLGVLLLGLLGLSIVGAANVLHDLAAAAAVLSAARIGAALRAAWRLLRVRLLAVRLSIGALDALLLAASVGLAGAIGDHRWSTAIAATLIAQILAFGRSVLRAYWLALAAEPFAVTACTSAAPSGCPSCCAEREDSALPRTLTKVEVDERLIRDAVC